MAHKEGVSGPHLSAAFLCEKILYERDGVPTFVRVVERFTIPVMPKLPAGLQLPPGMQIQTALIQITMVVMLKAGDLGSGKYNMKVTHDKPSGGAAVLAQTFGVFFNGGDENGVAVISPMQIPNPEEGLHWFNVYFEESLLTRIPMRVLYQSLPMVQPG